MNRHSGLLYGWCRCSALAAVLCVAALIVPHARAATNVLLSFNSAWAYFDRGYAPETGWFARGYDSAWNFGYAQFGYGEGDERTICNYGPDPNHKFITTYFRTTFSVESPTQFTAVDFSLVRADGAVVYLNGTELYRNNMPDDEIENGTLAVGELAPWERTVQSRRMNSDILLPGRNLVAVEVHKATLTSPDMSFDLQIAGITTNVVVAPPQITRGPYLQVGTSSNIVIRWRTAANIDTVVRYGTNMGAPDMAVTNTSLTGEHEILVPNLAPATRYYYEIATTVQKLAGDSSYTFTTAPVPGTVAPVRVWAIGDFGTGMPAQRNVRDAYAKFATKRGTDVWLMLGDNAYQSGFDYEYQSYVFEVYPTFFRQTVTWPTVGNHDTAQSSALSDAFAYYQIFTFPTVGQAGGVPSGSKHYYSYDYANVHFICLDSMAAELRRRDSAMCNWLKADLADTTRDWIIAYFHHPSYTRGTHDSDFYRELIEMRENVVPILEAGGVDLVLYGHSHCYERSYLIDGFYTYSWGVSPTNFVDHGDGNVNGTGAYTKPAGGMGSRRGTVYITDGSSGYNGAGDFGHPAVCYATADSGSVALDIYDQRLDGWFIREDGVIRDAFTIDKSAQTNVVPPLSITRTATNAIISWPTSLPDYRLESTHDAHWTETWAAAPLTVRTNGRRKMATVRQNPATNDYEFFRLRRAQ